MAEIALFFDSVAGDRAYNHQTFSDLFEGGVVSEGIVRRGAAPLRVDARVPTQMGVRVNPGSAWVRGKYYELDANLDIAVPAANAGLPRKDRVVIRLDYAARTMAIVYVQGVAAAGPAAPALIQNAGTWEISLAIVDVTAADVDIAANQITDTRVFGKIVGDVTPLVFTTAAAPTDLQVDFGSGGSQFTVDAAGRQSWGAPGAAKDAFQARTAAGVLTFQSTRVVADNGVDVGPTSVDGYTGGEVRFVSTAAGAQAGIASMASGAGIMTFDFRTAGNVGSWAFRNGLNATVPQMTLSAVGRLATREDIVPGAFGVTGAVRAADGARMVYFDAASIYVGAIDAGRAAYFRANGLDVMKGRTDGLAEFGVSGGTHESTRIDARAMVGGNGFAYASDGATHPAGSAAGLSVGVNRATPAGAFNNVSSSGAIIAGYSGSQLQFSVLGNGYFRQRGEMRVGMAAYGDAANSVNFWIYAPTGDANTYITSEGTYADVSMKIRAKGAGYCQFYVQGGGLEVLRVGNGFHKVIGFEHHFGQGAMGGAHSQLDVYADVGMSGVWLRAQGGDSGAFDRDMAFRAVSYAFYDGPGNITAQFVANSAAGAYQTSMYLYFKSWDGVARWSRVFAARNSSMDGVVGPNGHILYVTY